MKTHHTRIALITGASRGLGRNIASHLAERGVDPILTYHRNASAAAEVVDELRALGRRATALPLDVADSRAFPAFAAQVREVVQGWGRERFDILVNNAGSGLHLPYLETTEEQFDSMVAIHLKSAFFLTQALAPLLEDGGRILNVSSGLARFTVENYAAYAMAKGGVEVLTRYQARELAARRIKVNVIAPGAIETDFSGGAVRDNPQLNAMIAGMTALGRAGLPDDIGAAAAALLDEGNGWMTGQRIEVSGGMML
ncbi:short-chain dehydrogenase [Massilia sp. KIM]|uniref:SDR family NAD(P)-dependent oxidoreductase n=1 Tax=Massilia sp. KIM TaxID=1955422 RepID=UPI00098ECFD3|nr:SDR family oxidoreductase [Massilia sp. KIM]OON59175.1 short-chain dehydrogenase [Massilia sp. KIM]